MDNEIRLFSKLKNKPNFSNFVFKKLLDPLFKISLNIGNKDPIESTSTNAEINISINTISSLSLCPFEANKNL